MVDIDSLEEKLAAIIEDVLKNSEKIERQERLIIEFGLACLLCLYFIFGEKQKLKGKLELFFEGLVFEKCSKAKKLFSSNLLVFCKYYPDFGLLFSELLVRKLN